MRRSGLALVLAASALAACGSDDDGPAASTPQGEAPAAALDPDKEPRQITCRDLADKVGSARLSRTAGFTLADEALAANRKLARKTNRNLLAQQIFFAMTEACKGAPPAHRPAGGAVKQVVAGRYKLAPPDEKYVAD